MSKCACYPYNYAVHLTPDQDFMVILRGVGLSNLEQIRLDYITPSNAYQAYLFRRNDSTDTIAYFTAPYGNSPEQMYINYIASDDEYFYDKRSVQKYAKFTIKSNDETMGTVTPSGTSLYDAMEFIEATAEEGYHFVQWSDGDTRRERNIKLTGDIELTAIFAPDEAEEQPQQVTLTLNCDNDVVPAPSGAGTYDKGSTVTIEAVLLTPSENERGGITIYNFVQWSDGDYNRIREVVLENDLTLTALYVAQDQ